MDKISDAALKIVLNLFHVRSGHVKGEGRIDARFVHDITQALADHALTASQIRLLFRYTYTVEADVDLKHYFGWEEALREAVDSSEEEALRPKPPKLPPIDAKNFEVFKSELQTGTCGEITAVLDRWPFSFTLEQQVEVLNILKPRPNDDFRAERDIVRQKMQIHLPEDRP